MLPKNYKKKGDPKPAPVFPMPEIKSKDTREYEEEMTARTIAILRNLRKGIRGHSRWEQDIDKLIPMVNLKFAYNETGIHTLPVNTREGFYCKSKRWWDVAKHELCRLIALYYDAIKHQVANKYDVQAKFFEEMLEDKRGLNEYIAVPVSYTVGYTLRSKTLDRQMRIDQDKQQRQKKH